MMHPSRATRNRGSTEPHPRLVRRTLREVKHGADDLLAAEAGGFTGPQVPGVFAAEAAALPAARGPPHDLAVKESNA